MFGGRILSNGFWVVLCVRSLSPLPPPCVITEIEKLRTEGLIPEREINLWLDTHLSH